MNTIRNSILKSSIFCSLLLLASCSIGPDGFFESRWDDNISEVMAKAGLNCSGWIEWYTDKKFTTCICDTITVFEHSANVMIVKEDEQFEGVVFRFNTCTPSFSSDIKKTIIKHYNLEESKSGTLYHTWNNSFVKRSKISRLVLYDGKNCELTIAGNDFADFFSRDYMQRGILELQNGFRPH